MGFFAMVGPLQVFVSSHVSYHPLWLPGFIRLGHHPSLARTAARVPALLPLFPLPSPPRRPLGLSFPSSHPHRRVPFNDDHFA